MKYFDKLLKDLKNYGIVIRESDENYVKDSFLLAYQHGKIDLLKEQLEKQKKKE